MFHDMKVEVPDKIRTCFRVEWPARSPAFSQPNVHHKKKNPALLTENGVFLQIMPNSRQLSISISVCRLKLIRCVFGTTGFQGLIASKKLFVVIT